MLITPLMQHQRCCKRDWGAERAVLGLKELGVGVDEAGRRRCGGVQLVTHCGLCFRGRGLVRVCGGGVGRHALLTAPRPRPGSLHTLSQQ